MDGRGAHPWHPLGSANDYYDKIYAIHNDISVETKKAIFVPNNFLKFYFTNRSLAQYVEQTNLPYPVADLGWHPRHVPLRAQQFLNFMQYFGNFRKIVCWRSLLWGILDPPPLSLLIQLISHACDPHSRLYLF